MDRLSRSRETPLTELEKDPLRERIDRVHDLTNFLFQVIVLAAQADEEQVAEIFVRTNSEGVQLNQADFILTLMSVHWEQGQRSLEAFARSAVDPSVTGPSARNPLIDPLPDQMLRAVIARWFFMAQTTGRYTSSPESQIESDLARLRTLSAGDVDGYRAELDRVIHADFTGFWVRFGNATKQLHGEEVLAVPERPLGLSEAPLSRAVSRRDIYSDTIQQWEASRIWLPRCATAPRRHRFATFTTSASTTSEIRGEVADRTRCSRRRGRATRGSTYKAITVRPRPTRSDR